MALVDFSNPDAARWYCDHVEALIDLGVDSFKTDFGERIPTDVVYHDGSDPVLMHNVYTQLYNAAVFEAIERRRGRGEAHRVDRGVAGRSRRPQQRQRRSACRPRRRSGHLAGRDVRPSMRCCAVPRAGQAA